MNSGVFKTRDMSDDFFGLLSTDKWPPRWICGDWTALHGWFYILSDLSIGLAYFAIPVILYYFIRKRKNELPFVQVFWLFILFILACGTTHFADAALFWFPAYRLSGAILFVTGIISWVAVLGLVRVLPEALKLKTNEQLEEIVNLRTEQLEETNKNLRNINLDLDNFVYAASHDLKSPINNIEGLVALLKNANSKEDGAEIIQKIEKSVNRVKETIGQLSAVVKVQRTEENETEEINIGDLLDEIVSENTELVRTTNPVFVKHLEVHSVRYPRATLKSILYNLVTNAMKYSSSERSLAIHIRTFRKNDHVFLEVEDNGTGIDLKKNKEKLFSIFSRFHDHVEGSGIGLFMVKRLLEKRKGEITVKSEPNKGSIFTVKL